MGWKETLKGIFTSKAGKGLTKLAKSKQETARNAANFEELKRTQKATGISEPLTRSEINDAKRGLMHDMTPEEYEKAGVADMDGEAIADFQGRRMRGIK